MRPRFQADADFNHKIVVGLRRREPLVDFRSALEGIESQASPGVIIVPQSVEVGDAIEDLLLIWAATNAEEWVDRLGLLPV